MLDSGQKQHILLGENLCPDQSGFSASSREVFMLEYEQQSNGQWGINLERE